MLMIGSCCCHTLLLHGGWQVVSGAIEEGESPVEALLREVAEEAGPEVSIRPVGSVHTWLHHFDAAVPAMLSIAYVATYLGGEVLREVIWR